MVEDSDIYGCAPEQEKGREELHLERGERSLTFSGIVAAFHELTNYLHTFSDETRRLLYVLCEGMLQRHSRCCVSQKLLMCVGWCMCTCVHGRVGAYKCLEAKAGIVHYCLPCSLEVGFLLDLLYQLG